MVWRIVFAGLAAVFTAGCGDAPGQVPHGSKVVPVTAADGGAMGIPAGTPLLVTGLCNDIHLDMPTSRGIVYVYDQEERMVVREIITGDVPGEGVNPSTTTTTADQRTTFWRSSLNPGHIYGIYFYGNQSTTRP